MKSYVIKVESFNSIEELMSYLKNILIKDEFTVISTKGKDYFTIMKDNKFGSVFYDKFKGICISSAYKPGRDTGTGCEYMKAFEVKIEDFNNSLNYCFNGLKPVFFKDIKDYLVSNYNVFNLTVEDAKGKKTSLETLEDYYIFISDNYAPIITENHQKAFGYYNNPKYSKSYKCVFRIINGTIEQINHNINMFEDMSIMNNFKNRILGA